MGLWEFSPTWDVGRTRKKRYESIQKDFDGKMQEFVAGISHHVSKKLCQKCASSPNFMCLAKRFNAVFNDNFPKFWEWNKG